MKKLATIVSEVPQTRVGLIWYIQLAEKEIRKNQTNINELQVAVSEAKTRLVKIDDQRSGDETTADPEEKA